ncbi:MAG: hypothetical protein ACI8RD_011168 [Bacillariaceae sp.]
MKTLADIENDNVVFLLTTHVRHIVKQGMIPHGWWKENGWKQTNAKAMKVTSLIKIVEPLYSILQNCFPSHHLLMNNPKNPTSWWTGIKGNLTKGLTKQRQKGEDEEFDPKTASLYIVNRHPLLIKYKLGQMHYLEEADLYHMAKKMMRKSRLHGCDIMLHRAQIVISAFAVSRGGEIKWSRFSFWTYDPRLDGMKLKLVIFMLCQ